MYGWDGRLCELTERQYNLADQAKSLGWTPEQIRILDGYRRIEPRPARQERQRKYLCDGRLSGADHG
jgi:hypothetical protein